ncbi:MAG: hypothetical protein LBD11_07615 [Candidatus Peribacteria bacterium]|nr:hypothetical protein [Candidatus Peribacteria bacterium]
MKTKLIKIKPWTGGRKATEQNNKMKKTEKTFQSLLEEQYERIVNARKSIIKRLKKSNKELKEINAANEELFPERERKIAENINVPVLRSYYHLLLLQAVKIRYQMNMVQSDVLCYSGELSSLLADQFKLLEELLGLSNRYAKLIQERLSELEEK